ncbi:hypothetical protein IMZ31_21225 (plasmid) [Pontibacillus sp. ALD_SL1]|uniref:hypothetical protein n=1 Tax=Pontibacillus sp. ALD_SL1 TaxID=2777185 RepID=UPI001A9609C5|nr:hypothetical protein [Pontibacillus sp. ALD_SL1]QST03073.1 hypothetical protein IMZ31_21225 [Pontibacillus sp. ALD_SL1]
MSFSEHPSIRKITSQLNWGEVKHHMNEHLQDICTAEDHNKKALYLSNLLGFPLIGNGKFRFVIEVDGAAAKLPLYSAGYRDNIEERDFWGGLPGSLKPHFAPILGFDNGILLFKKAAHVSERDFHQVYKQKRITLIKKIQEVTGFIMEDLESHVQWGELKGKLVILDFSEWTV